VNKNIHSAYPPAAYKLVEADDVEVAAVEVALGFCNTILESASGASLGGLEMLPAGVCADCGAEHRRLYLYGATRRSLCRGCATARARVRPSRNDMAAALRRAAER
jgi:hypothetical protein